MTLSLKHIQLHNFRGVKSLEWSFHDQPGLYFVQGHNLKEPTLGANGAGKSTIFVDAPYWILTGKTIMSQRPGSSIESWGQENRSATYGELTLVIGHSEYVIRRGRNPSVLTINSRTVEQHEIDKLIPLSDSALRRTLLLGQRSLMFLDLRPEEKSRLFSETLDLDIWLRAADLAGNTLRDKEREAAKIEAQFSAVTGSMNEIRDQHEAAIIKEEEFDSQHAVKLRDTRQIGQEEVRRLDALNTLLAEAQERMKQSAQSSTSDDELRAHRAAERALRDQRVLLDDKLTRTEKESSQLVRQIASYNDNQCPECGQTVNEEHNQQRRTELRETYDAAMRLLHSIPTLTKELDTKIADSEKHTLKLEEANKEYRETRIAVEALQTQITAQERTVVRITNDIKKIEAETNPFTSICDDLENRYNTLNKQRDALSLQDKELDEQIEILRFWQKGYRDIRLEQIDATLLELELATNRNATALGLQDWEIQFATERETKSGSVSHAFSIFLFPPGQTKPVPWDSYSGGEAQRWQLAVTFALSEVLLSRAGIQPDFEILDEPTGFLSREGIDDLLDCLHTRAHELQRRVYLIDHRSLERGSFDGIVTVVKDNSGIRIET